MTKQELIVFVKGLPLDEKFMTMLVTSIEASSEITPQLLNSLAKMFEAYAEYENTLASHLDQMAQEVEKFAGQFKELGDKEIEERLKVVQTAQEQALASIQVKINELKSQA